MNKKSFDAVVNLSGGIDSAYLLWKYLSAGKRVLVHHCNLKNFEGRVFVEKAATYNILKWLKDSALDNFHYIETSYDYGNANFVIRDIEIIYFLTAMILRDPQYRDIQEIAVSANSTDESNNPNEQSVVRRSEILKSILPRKEFEGYDSVAKLTFPVIHKSKKDMILEMPEDLFSKTWFCRKPMGFDKDGVALPKNSDNAVSWKACGGCAPCTSVIKSFE
jgi:7-cyano-7-deazaguanine synthase in queuosine biosynthesis